MAILVMKKITLLFILITALLLSTSFAGGRMRYMGKTSMNVGANSKEQVKKSSHMEKAIDVHERLLRANTKDYGSYSPPPVLGKPPFKLIPN